MDITERLTELAYAAADNNWSEFSMRIPAEPERDADLVLLRAGKEIERLRSTITRLEAELAKADGQINRCVDQNKYLESTISRLREYADHKITCGTLSADYFIEKQGCDCGYDELMAELEETK